jgi:hypothetical protein
MVGADVLPLAKRAGASWYFRVPLLLSFIVIVGAAAITSLGLFAPVPNTTDEAVYIELARHLSASGRFEILGVPFPALTYGPAYVVLLAPIFRVASSAREAYMLARGLNAFIFATAAIPAFFIAARALSRRSALIVAAVTIGLPAGAYATKVMTESLAFTVVLWTVVAALRVSERPTIQRQSALLLLTTVASAVRFELLVLGPALSIACAIGGSGRIRENCRRLSPLLIGTALILAGTAGLLQATSRAASGAGAHGFALQGFSLLRFGAVLVGSVGAIDLYTGVLPFACFLLVVISMLRHAPWVSPGLRAIVLIAAAGGSALVLTSSAYLVSVPVAFRPPIPSDRYTFYFAPLIFVVFAAWIESGAIREAGTAWVAAIAATLPLIAAIVYIGHHTLTFSGLAFLPWVGLGVVHPLLLLGPLAAYCGLCAFLLSRQRTTIPGLIKPLMTLLPVTLLCASVFFVRAPTYSPPPGWLDAHSKPGAIAVWGVTPTERRSKALGEILSANTNLSAVYFTRKADTRGFDQVETRVTKRADGTLLDKGRPLMARYVLTDAETHLVGTLLAKRNGFAIYEVQSPVRLAGIMSLTSAGVPTGTRARGLTAQPTDPN